MGGSGSNSVQVHVVQDGQLLQVYQTNQEGTCRFVPNKPVRCIQCRKEVMTMLDAAGQLVDCSLCGKDREPAISILWTRGLEPTHTIIGQKIFRLTLNGEPWVGKAPDEAIHVLDYTIDFQDRTVHFDVWCPVCQHVVRSKVIPLFPEGTTTAEQPAGHVQWHVVSLLPGESLSAPMTKTAARKELSTQVRRWRQGKGHTATKGYQASDKYPWGYDKNLPVYTLKRHRKEKDKLTIQPVSS